jgi:hypothetical protein
LPLPARVNLAGMNHSRTQQTSWLSLEADAASAGLALACVYSSSDEFEAEIIYKRRRAAHNEKQRLQRVYFAFFGAAASIAALIYLTA